MDLTKLTTIEKTKMVMGADFWCNETLDGRVYRFVVSDGPIGLRQPLDRMAVVQDDVIKSVAYPSTQVLSQTWNRDLVWEMGRAIANDCIEQNVDVILGPGVNIKRNPLNGRNFEYFSEDPYLAGTMAKEYIQGVQSMHVGTCLKHFCCNNMEFSRKWASMEVDERTLREIYLKPFEIAMEAKPWSLMCSYNLVNGRRMSENTKLYDITRDEFGFDGLIISDWEAVKNPEASLNAGLGLEMPYNEEHHKEMMEKAEKGLLDSEKLDKAAGSVIAFAEKCEAEKKLRKMNRTLDERRETALHIEEEGIVLLKNQDHVLPMKKGTEVIVSGAPAFRYYFGGGSSNVKPEMEFVPLADALNQKGIHATFKESVWDTLGGECHVGNIKACMDAAVQSDYTVLCVGDSHLVENESYDRETMKLSNEEENVIHSLSKVAEHLIIVVEAGAPIDMASWIDEVDAVLYMGYGGERGHEALANVLVGDVNPSGKLSETFPLALEDVPAVKTYRDGSVIVYSEGLNVGYRYFETFNKPVLFPFGYGLSYSEFEYSNLNVEKKDGEYQVSFDIKNISDVDGKEVAELYIRELVKDVYRPDHELKGYEKVFLKAGETKSVTIRLPRKAFSYYSVAYDEERIRPGTFEILIGRDAHRIVLRKRIQVK